MNSWNEKKAALHGNVVVTVAVAAAVISILVYLKALSCGFINYDDPDYVLNNPVIRSFDWHMLRSAVTQSHVGYWMPLTWISLALDYHFWELNPVGYHLTNILLHAANSGVVVLVANRVYRQTGSVDESAAVSKLIYPGVLLLTGLLWGLHPLRVESVAWVTERKDVLNGLFSLASILFYFRYCQLSEGVAGRKCAYLVSLFLFALSLMAKSVSVVIPAMLLVADWYPLGRMQKGCVNRLLVEKSPYILLSILMSAVTFYSTAHSNYLVSYEAFPFWQRLVVSGNAVFEYIRMMLLPYGILPYHMIPDPIPAAYAIKMAAVIMLTGWIFFVSKRRWLCAAWLAFILPLLPVLAFFQNGDQSLAARFTYLPALAPSLAAGAVILAVCRRCAAGSRFRPYTLISALLITLLLHAGLTVRLIDVWKSSTSFWSRVIDVEPGVVAYKERGRIYYVEGDFNAAIADYSAAIGIAAGGFKATIFNLYGYRGDALLAAGHYDEAIQDFTTAIAMLPHPAYYYRRGLAFEKLGRLTEASEDFVRSGPGPIPMEWFDR